MLESTLSELEASALARIHAAASPEELEPVRIEVLGRKGTLAAISKDFGKLSADDRAKFGKLLNSAKKQLESALESRQSEFEKAALDARLQSEWLDLTEPAPGPRPGSLLTASSQSSRRWASVGCPRINPASAGIGG